MHVDPHRVNTVTDLSRAGSDSLALHQFETDLRAHYVLDSCRVAEARPVLDSGSTTFLQKIVLDVLLHPVLIISLVSPS